MLLALGLNVLRFFPALHHHEEQHACIGKSGSYYHLETEPHQHTDQFGKTTPHLVRVRLGDAHNHELCGLCQFIPSLLDGQPQTVTHGVVALIRRTSTGESSLTRGAETHRPRGPPLII